MRIAERLHCRSGRFADLRHATTVHLKPLVLNTLRATPHCVIVEDVERVEPRMYRFLQELYYVPNACLVATTRSRNRMGHLRKLLWDPREEVALKPLTNQESLRLFEEACRVFRLDLFDLDDFRQKVIHAARGNPGRFLACAVSPVNLNTGTDATSNSLRAMSDTMTMRVAPEAVRNALQIVAQICQSHQITALDDFIESCRMFAHEEILNVAILGRFKAGKSSFLNHLLGRQLLPAGAIPVTAVVTEIEYGPHDRAEVVFKDGNTEQISPERISDFISETENPANFKQVLRVRLEMRSMAPCRGIRFRRYAGTGERPGTQYRGFARLVAQCGLGAGRCGRRPAAFPT